MGVHTGEKMEPLRGLKNTRFTGSPRHAHTARKAHVGSTAVNELPSVAGTHALSSDILHTMELGQLQCMRATTMHDRTYIRAHSCTQGVAPKASVPRPRIWTGTDC